MQLYRIKLFQFFLTCGEISRCISDAFFTFEDGEGVDLVCGTWSEVLDCVRR